MSCCSYMIDEQYILIANILNFRFNMLLYYPHNLASSNIPMPAENISSIVIGSRVILV